MAKIPGEAIVSVPIGKMDVVGGHLATIIQLIALEFNPLSTHLLVMASNQLIMDVARKRQVALEWDHKIWIKEEHHKDYVNLVNKAYNYFKHADRDADLAYSGPAVAEIVKLNECKTLLAIKGHKLLGGEQTQAFNIYIAFMTMRYPAYFNLDFLEAVPGLREAHKNVSLHRGVQLIALRDALFREGFLNRVPDIESRAIR